MSVEVVESNEEFEMTAKKTHKQASFLGADDPFHPREGKRLTWTNVNMAVVRHSLSYITVTFDC